MYTLLVITLTILVWLFVVALIYLFCENEVVDDIQENMKCHDRFDESHTDSHSKNKNNCSDKENCNGTKSNCTKDN